MTKLKRFYDSAPLAVQRALILAEGIRAFRDKYGGEFPRRMAELELNEQRSASELVRWQRERLVALLQFARAHVPYYRGMSLDPGRLESWPILDKKAVIAAGRTLVADNRGAGRLREFHTSGTTGTPLTVWADNTAYRTEMAFRWRHRAWTGVRFRDRIAYFSGHPIVPSRQFRPPFWRRDVVENRMLFSSYHISETTLPYYLEALRRFRPTLIHGYPSSVYLVARAVIQTGTAIRPTAVITASETLLTHQRVLIEKAFACRVHNWYGQTEMTCNIVECGRGGLHVRSDYGIVELHAGGEMICTGLNNWAMPLIRYRTGDTATPSGAGTCPCESPFPLVGSIEGRVEDYVITPEGYRVGRLDHLFKGLTGIMEAQIVQHTSTAIVIRIIRGHNYSRNAEEIIRRLAAERLGAMEVCFDYVERIERTTTGKCRFVVSHLPSHETMAAPNGAATHRG